MPRPSEPWPYLRNPNGNYQWFASDVSALDEETRMEFEERSALIEEGCHVTREAAEALTWEWLSRGRVWSPGGYGGH